MVIHFVALQGIGLAGGYLFCLTDTFHPPRGAAGFRIAAVASLTIAGAGVLACFLGVSRDGAPRRVVPPAPTS